MKSCLILLKTVSTRLVWVHLDLLVYIIAEEEDQISGLALMAEINFWAVCGRLVGVKCSSYWLTEKEQA